MCVCVGVHLVIMEQMDPRVDVQLTVSKQMEGRGYVLEQLLDLRPVLRPSPHPHPDDGQIPFPLSEPFLTVPTRNQIRPQHQLPVFSAI